MMVAVVVSVDGSLRETLARAEAALLKAKRHMRSRSVDIVVHGPRKGFTGKKLTKLQYRLTCHDANLKGLWTATPDEVMQVGA